MNCLESSSQPQRQRVVACAGTSYTAIPDISYQPIRKVHPHLHAQWGALTREGRGLGTQKRDRQQAYKGRVTCQPTCNGAWTSGSMQGTRSKPHMRATCMSRARTTGRMTHIHSASDTAMLARCSCGGRTRLCERRGRDVPIADPACADTFPCAVVCRTRSLAEQTL